MASVASTRASSRTSDWDRASLPPLSDTSSGRYTPLSGYASDAASEMSISAPPASTTISRESSAIRQPTQWQDADVHSRLELGNFIITKQKSVSALEHVIGLPSYHPVPRQPTAYIFDLRGSQYDALAQNGDKPPLRADALIKNKV